MTIFNYEDIIGRTNLDFEKIVGNYFTCLIKLCKVEELFKEYMEFIVKQAEYTFMITDRLLAESLSKEDLEKFEKFLLKEARNNNEKRLLQA